MHLLLFAKTALNSISQNTTFLDSKSFVHVISIRLPPVVVVGCGVFLFCFVFYIFLSDFCSLYIFGSKLTRS